MKENDEYNFTKIISKMIKKSLFTERQIEIILNFKNLEERPISISRGAYYRQVKQCREKLLGLFYSFIILQGIGILLPDDIDVISRLSKQVSVIKDSDIFPEQEQNVLDLIEKSLKQTIGL